MIKKLTAVAGFGAGYVLGAKAGQERYRQIMTKIDELRGSPQVEKATDVVAAKAVDLTDAVKDKANETVEKVTLTTPAATL